MSPSLGLDHVYLRVHDPDAVLALFHLQLGLPVSWPLRDEPFARYAWVNAGNVQIELWQARSDSDLPPATALPLVAGLALWPSEVHASRDALALQGVRCKEPRAWRTEGAGGDELNFTNCLVLDATGPACQVFFCEWHPDAPIAPWPKGETTPCRRERLAKELAGADNGGVGIEGLCAIHMQTPDVARSARVWNAITGAVGIAAPGVALVLTPGHELEVTALVMRVRDLPAARARLEQQRLRTEHSDGVLWLDEKQAFGLRIGLAG
ncbi:MAG: hypothetical protein EOO27_45725 [Comamonadaceae bacterium]|nr:MAG: hypothetical protein EOO27_45725 [Comamonadaceae bacterium]